MVKVLVVDDEQVMRSVLRRFLERRGHHVVEAENGLEALDKLAEGGVDLAIVDLMMPRMDGFELIRLASERFADTGIVVISGVAKELERASAELNVLAALGKPFELAELDRAIRTALPEEPPLTEKKRILLVDDEVTITRTLALYLEGTGRYEVRTENESPEALRTARMFQPHLVLLDISMPDMDGGEVAAQMQKDPALAGVPIVFLTALVRREELEAIGSEIAGRPYIAKPVDPEEVIACIEEHTK